MSNDLTLNVSAMNTAMAAMKKPPYLIILTHETMPSKARQHFVSLDKPEILDGFVQVKGFYCEMSADEITKTFVTLLTNTNRELYCELMIPWHRVVSMQNLMYKAK